MFTMIALMTPFRLSPPLSGGILNLIDSPTLTSRPGMSIACSPASDFLFIGLPEIPRSRRLGAGGQGGCSWLSGGFKVSLVQRDDRGLCSQVSLKGHDRSWRARD